MENKNIEKEIEMYEQIKQHIREYPKKFENVVVFSINDFAKTYNYNIEDILKHTDKLENWHTILLESGKPVINLELNQYIVYDNPIEETEKIYSPKGEGMHRALNLKELKKKYPESDELFKRLESTEHTVKLTIKTRMVVEYKNDTFTLKIIETHKIDDMWKTSFGWDKQTHTLKNIEYFIFSFKSAREIEDIFLNKRHYNIDSILTYRGNTVRTGNYEGENLFNILDYVASGTVKLLYKNNDLAYKILSILKQIIHQKEITSSILTICEHDNKLVFPEVIKSPILHDYSSMPTPDEWYEQLNSITVSSDETKELLHQLTKLNKDHNILVMSYFLATLLNGLIYPTIPYLMIYGSAGKGKTTTADIFKFFDIQTDRPTTYQIMKTCHGYACGFFLLDEPKSLSKDVIDMLKSLSTKPIYRRVYGKTGQKYVFKVGGIITTNNPYDIDTKTPDDLKGFLRRNIPIKIKETDYIEGITNTIEKLKTKGHLKIKKIFIDWILSQNPETIKEHYEKITKQYLLEKYGIDVEGGQELAYKFIVFGLELLNKLFNDNGIDDFINKNRIGQILHRIKEDEKEYVRDIMNDDNIVEMIEQMIFNDLLRISTMKDREPELLTSPDVINKYSELLYNTNGYTMYFVENKKKKRICINRTGLIRLIKRLNSEYGTNYPEQININYFMEKLREKDINAEIAQKRISPNPRAKKPKALFIEVPYNFEIKSYEDILIVLKVLSDMSNGKLPKSEFKDTCLSRGILETRILEGLIALKAYGIVKEEEGYLHVNIKELNNILEEEYEEEHEEPLSIEDAVKETIKELEKEQNEVPEHTLLKKLNSKGYDIDEDSLEKILNKLKLYGEIHEVRSGRWKIL
jgi:chromosome segregation protein